MPGLVLNEGYSSLKVTGKVSSFDIIEAGSALLNQSVIGRLNTQKFPATIEGNLIYSSKYHNWPVVKALVILTFTKEGKDSIHTNSVSSDENGYFIIPTPDSAVKYEKVMVDVSRNGVRQVFTYSRGMTKLMEGNLGSLVVQNNFYVEGMFERIGNLVDNINNTIPGAETSSGQASSNPKVILGEGENAFSLSWANAPSFGYSYKILHRLVEPQVSPPAIISKDPSKNKQRGEIGCPIDVAKFKKKLIEAPRNQPRMSSLGMGYVLFMNQEWQPSHFSLGTLLYSLPLAPGEEQRLAISERTETLAVTDRESANYFQSDRYSSLQMDSASAAYYSALEDTVNGWGKMSGHNYGASFGSGTAAAGGGSYGPFSILGGASALFGIGGTKTSSSSSFSQTHNQDYTSNIAQSFQQNIQRAAESQSLSNRIGVRLASANESEMVTTKIIANNNHSHALTMQFWEVVQNYKITTNITGVQLVLYIPLDIVQFLPTNVAHVLTPGQLYEMTQKSSGKAEFINRYDMLIKHYDPISLYIPYQYRNGLNILKKFSSYPRWEFQSGESEDGFTVQFKVKGSFMPFDIITPILRLKNGRQISAVNVAYDTHQVDDGYNYSSDVLADIRRKRIEPTKTITGSFRIPSGVIDDDFANLELYYSCNSFTYTLTLPEIIRNMFPGYSIQEIIASPIYPLISRFLNQQEAFANPVVKLTQSQLRSLGPLRITEVELSNGAQTKYISINTDEELTYCARFNVVDRYKTMTFEQLQEIERSFQHVIENTMYYSQAVWASLTSDERAIMLEQYTIGIPGVSGEIGEEIPLMNCVQNEVYGFYGNCMLMPFSYPPELADLLNTSTREIQDALYNYHTMAFRPTTSMVSMSTRGMVGEAVLGNSNASEKIDLTRFWNWNDSPITHSDAIKPSDFSQEHIITENTAASDKLTKSENTVNITSNGASAPDLLSSLVNIPSNANQLVGLAELEKFASSLTSSGSAERQKVIDNASTLTQKAIDGYVKMKTGKDLSGDKEEEKGKEKGKDGKTENQNQDNKTNNQNETDKQNNQN